MARFPTFYLIGIVAPVLLLLANLVWGVGGIVATAGLLLWIGLGIMLLPTDEEAAA